MTAPARPPAVMYLAEPGGRHPAPSRLAAEVAAELEQLHARCLAGLGNPIDAGEALLEVTAAGRVRFVDGNSSSAMPDSDLVDAVVHAARCGYRLCLARGTDPRGYCWLPDGHDDGCELRGWWRWSLLYGYRGPVRLVCTRCTPHRHVPAPDDCPHQ